MTSTIANLTPEQVFMIDSTDAYHLDTTTALNTSGTGFHDAWLNSY